MRAEQMMWKSNTWRWPSVYETLCEELEEGKASGGGHQQNRGMLHLIQGFEEQSLC